MEKFILEVDHLRKEYEVRQGLFGRIVSRIKAVDDVSFLIKEGKTFGLVGESGCGKTTVGKTILRLIEPTAGRVFFCGDNVFLMDRKTMKRTRPEMQMIFQDPYSSLDPRMTVFSIVSEAVLEHDLVDKGEIQSYVENVLDSCGLSAEYIDRFPHEFSGGQRQRICIARALALNPKLIICDEPVSALDVSIQAQIINLMKKIQRERGISYLFISHDLAVVEHISDEVGVMYLGKLVETAPKKEIFHNPLHPYTKALLSVIPIPDPSRRRRRVVLEGDVPTPDAIPCGCRFHTRCLYCSSICKEQEPELRDCGNGHRVACHFI